MLFDPAIIALTEQCAPDVHARTMATLVQTESSNNPLAIGVVGMTLAEQPKTKAEAITTATALLKGGATIAVGLSQINTRNLESLGLTLDAAFDSCPNLKGGAQILQGCYQRAVNEFGEGQPALQAALSCYYSNNFSTGLKDEGKGKGSYVERIAKNHDKLIKVPEIQFSAQDVKEAQQNKADISKPVAPVQALEELAAPATSKAASWDVMEDFAKP